MRTAVALANLDDLRLASFHFLNPDADQMYLPKIVIEEVKIKRRRWRPIDNAWDTSPLFAIPLLKDVEVLRH